MLISDTHRGVPKVPRTTSLPKSPMLSSQRESNRHLYLCKW